MRAGSHLILYPLEGERHAQIQRTMTQERVKKYFLSLSLLSSAIATLQYLLCLCVCALSPQLSERFCHQWPSEEDQNRMKEGKKEKSSSSLVTSQLKWKQEIESGHHRAEKNPAHTALKHHEVMSTLTTRIGGFFSLFTSIHLTSVGELRYLSSSSMVHGDDRSVRWPSLSVV